MDNAQINYDIQYLLKFTGYDYLRVDKILDARHEFEKQRISKYFKDKKKALKFNLFAALVYVLGAAITGINPSYVAWLFFGIGISASIYYNSKLWSASFNIQEDSVKDLKRISINQFVNEHWIEQD